MRRCLASVAFCVACVGSVCAAEFSFVYDGTPVRDAWKAEDSSVRTEDGRRVMTRSYSAPSGGLEVSAVTTTYEDFPATHTVMFFANRGTTDTAIVENVLPIDTAFYVPGSGDVRVAYSRGSSQDIRDFCPLDETLATSASIHLSPVGGRSSDGVLPFFNFRKPDGRGYAVCIGWSGQWKADVSRVSDDVVRVSAGMEQTHFRLHPGERVRTPAVLRVALPAGDEASGFNYLRSFLLKYFSPRRNGKLIEGPVCTSHNYQFEKQTAELHQKGVALIDEHHLKSDYYFIDTGWGVSSTGNPYENWAVSIGNFDYEPVRYPHGVRPISDASHATGRGFLLWFEPERVMTNTQLFREHRNWLIAPPAADSLPDGMRYMFPDYHLFDLANDDARTWLIKKVSGMIEAGGIDVYRHDFNMYPLWFWRKDEPADRQGVHEMKYVAGLYAYFDGLVKAHPKLILDSCASGGRRIDLELISRAFELIRSDYLWDPIGQQCHTWGLNRWLPLTGVGAAGGTMYNARSGYGYNYILALDWPHMDAERWSFARKTFEEIQSVRHLFMGDFYPLTDYSVENNVWMAWQFDRKDSGEGLVQIFRRAEATEGRRVFKLRGLEGSDRYRVKFVDDPARNRLYTGDELMNDGIVFELSPEVATYITYERHRLSTHR